MKIAAITGSRSDRNAILAVRDALAAAGHDVDMVEAFLAPLAITTDIITPFRAVRVALEETTIALGEYNPDLVFVHGDRHEIVGAVMGAVLAGVPVAHIGGGDITIGSQDDSFRHAITKLSHLHFATNEESAARIVQMGEDPSRVYTVGDPGIDAVMKTPVLSREETFSAVCLKSCERTLLVSFHPNTLGDTAPELAALSAVLKQRTEGVVLIGPNQDAGAELIHAEWQRLADSYPDRIVYFTNVPSQVFYSLMRWCDVMVGNSSAGYYEAPCFGIPVVDIGDRQKGRPQAPNVGNYMPDPERIEHGIANRPRYWASACPNPYGDGKACQHIVSVVNALPVPTSGLLRKEFHNFTYGLIDAASLRRQEG